MKARAEIDGRQPCSCLPAQVRAAAAAAGAPRWSPPQWTLSFCRHLVDGLSRLACRKKIPKASRITQQKKKQTTKKKKKKKPMLTRNFQKFCVK